MIVLRRSHQLLLVALGLSMGLVGCVPTATFNFDAAPRLNNDLLLTIDLVQVSDAEEQEIRRLQGEWFYSDLRRQLASRTRTVTLEGGERKVATLVPDKGCKQCTRLVVVADYRSGQGGWDIPSYDKKDWKGKTVTVSARDSNLVIRVK